MHVYLVTPGFEEALAAELAPAFATRRALAPGIVVADGAVADAPAADPAFARQVLPDATEVTGASVRALAEAAYTATEAAIDRGGGPFTIHALTADDIHPRERDEPPLAAPGVGSRARLVAESLLQLLRERRRRAARRYVAPEAATPAAFGPPWVLAQLLALDRERLLVSAVTPRPLARGGLDLAPWPAGAAPVAIDRAPPSRAYQKLEEAFQWLGAAPTAGELCVDLGAAPGGWTATAARRDARVIAVDRAPLEPPAAGDRRVTAVIGNAFTYAPPHPADWLLSDVICAPPRSIALITEWLQRGWCRNLVVTIKFKGRAGYGVLRDLDAVLDGARAELARVKQLVHNKNEVCVMLRGARVRNTP